MGNTTVYIIIPCYDIFEEWNSCMNYFKYIRTCSSNITIALFCLIYEYFRLEVEVSLFLKKCNFPLCLKTHFLAVVCEVIELVYQITDVCV